MNKKGFLLVVLFIIIITGCSSKRHMVCNTTSIFKSSIIHSTYDISYKDNVVYNVVKKEIITNKNTDILYDFRDSIQNSNADYNKLSHYNNYVKIKDDTLISITKINYNRLDLNKYVKIDRDNKKIISSNRVLFDRLIKYYSELGLVCDNAS